MSDQGNNKTSTIGIIIMVLVMVAALVTLNSLVNTISIKSQIEERQ